jgi:hypothetical protein
MSLASLNIPKSGIYYGDFSVFDISYYCKLPFLYIKGLNRHQNRGK